MADLEAAEVREHVEIPEAGVDLLRLRRQIGIGVDAPPLAREVGEGLVAGIEKIEVAQSLPSP